MASKLQLNPANVPPELHQLIPLAELWGLSDDCDREQAVEQASPDQIAELKAAVDRFADSLDRWLAGSEANGVDFSDDYIAFSAMIMAADFA